jgi:aldehyde:ferredoxin oxidoreductase
VKPGGFAGNILYVNLTDRQIEKEKLDADLAEKFIGGLGICIKLASDRIEPGVDAFSPGNAVVIGAGPLVGTNLPASSRVYAVTKLPANGAVGWCGGGGVTFGCMLKNAGYDHIVIEGQADRPVYLLIQDDRVEIRDAGSLWGKGIEETCTQLWREHGSPGGVIAIGQAGENLVRFAMAYIDRLSTIGRGGLGAVMGAKGLKAVFVQGSRGVQVADEKGYRELSSGILKTIRNFPQLKEWQELGLLKTFPLVPRELYLKLRKRRIACVSCPVGDKEIIALPDGLTP